MNTKSIWVIILVSILLVVTPVDISDPAEIGVHGSHTASTYTGGISDTTMQGNSLGLDAITVLGCGNVIDGAIANIDSFNFTIELNSCPDVLVENITIDGTSGISAISILDSPNVTINNIEILNANSITNINAISIINSANSTISNVYIEDNFAAVGYNYTGLKILNTDNVTVTNYHIQGSDILRESGFIGANIENSNNVSLSDFDLYNHHSEEDVFGLIADNSLNLTLHDLYFNDLTSLYKKTTGLFVINSDQLRTTSLDLRSLHSSSTGFDFGNQREVNIMIFENIQNVTIFDAFVYSIISESNINVIKANGVDLLHINATWFQIIEGYSLNIVNIENGQDFIFTNNVILDTEATSTTGIVSLNLPGNITISNNTFDHMKSNSLATIMHIEGTDDVRIKENHISDINSTSTSLEQTVIYLTDCDDSIIYGNYFESVFTSSAPNYAIFLNNNINTSVILNELNYIYSTTGPSVAVYVNNNQGIRIENTTLHYVISEYVPLSIQLNSVEITNGYAFYLKYSDDVSIINNTMTVVGIWASIDETNTNVVQINNEVNYLTSSIVSINKPEDKTVEVSTGSVEVIWSAITNPINASSNYTIYQNGVKMTYGNWTSGSDISFTMSNLTVGGIIAEITFTEANGFNTSDIMFLTVVESSPPQLTELPVEFTTVIGVDNYLRWKATDINPDIYSIFRNGTEIVFGYWESNVSIEFNLKDTPLGTWEFTIDIQDLSGNNVQDEIVISVIEPVVLEFLSKPNDMSFYEGELAYLNFSVNGVNGGEFAAYVDGLAVDSGVWVPSEIVSYNVSYLTTGDYDLSVLVIDEFGQSIDFEINVIVRIIQEQDQEDGGGILDFIQNLSLESAEEVVRENWIVFAGLGVAGMIALIVGWIKRAKVKSIAKNTATRTKSAAKKVTGKKGKSVAKKPTKKPATKKTTKKTKK